MKILIAGGGGFLGSALTKALQKEGHEVHILSRQRTSNPITHYWDGKTDDGWGQLINEMDVIVNLTGLTLEHWPWTKRLKDKFINSRVQPGLVLAQAVKRASHRPTVFVQISGVNYYGLRGVESADEFTPAAEDFLAQLTVKWEAATKAVEVEGVRHVVARTSVVLARHGGMFPYMVVPVRLFFGGRHGSGNQSMPWIHIEDWVGALKFLIQQESARGAFNLIAPEATSNAHFTRAIAAEIHRPYWFHFPAWLMRLALGEMSDLILEGRYIKPKRLLDSGYQFQYQTLKETLKNIL